MNDLRVLIVDDEPIAARRLRTLVQRMPGIAAIATAETGVAALAQAQEFTPNLLLLDIEMPGLNGLALAERFDRNEPPVIIFVTAFAEYAVAAFGLSAADYLLKPVEINRLTEALARARQRLGAHRSSEDMAALRETIAALRAAESARRSDNWLWLSDAGVRQRIFLPDLLWIEAERDYVRLHETKKHRLVRASLTEIAAKLPDADFIRVRRSALVRLSAVERIEREGERRYLIWLSNGSKVRVGRSYLNMLPALMARAQSGHDGHAS